MPLTPAQISNALDCSCPSPIDRDTFQRYLLDLLYSISSNTSEGGGGTDPESVNTYTQIVTNGVWTKPVDTLSFSYTVISSTAPADVAIADGTNNSNVGYSGLSGGHGVSRSSEEDLNGNAYTITSTNGSIVKIEYVTK